MVLLVVDAQRLITNEKLYLSERFISNVKKLIAAARRNNIEVIYVRHDDGPGEELTKGTYSFEIYDEFKPAENEKIFDKTVNSPFRDTGLLEYLKEGKTETVIIAGLQTDFCIDAAVKGAFEHGFHVIVPAYANSTVDNRFMTGEESYHYYNEYMWNKRYAECMPVEKVIEQMGLLQKADRGAALVQDHDRGGR